MMKRIRLLCALVAFTIAVPITGANAIAPLATSPGALCQKSEKMGGRSVKIKVSCAKVADFSGNLGIQNRAKSKTVSNGPKLRYSVNYFSECTPDMTLKLGCDAISEATCPGGGWRTFRVIRAINGPRAGQVVSNSPYCSLEPALEVPGAENDIAKVTLEQFRKMPLIASVIISQPKSFSLRNGHAHLYASSKNQNFNITLFDQDVRVRAIPVSYAWKYGDGSVRTLTHSGGPVADHGFDEPTSTSHVYKETGDFRVGLTTSFRGEYSTEGGPWTPIPGLANVPSEQITMSVWRTKKILVADDCSQDPSGPGCTSPFE